MQQGRLRIYLVVILTATLALIFGFGGFPPPLDMSAIAPFTLDFSGELKTLRLVSLFLICGTSLACVLLVNDFFAILAFGASGLGVGVLMALEPAPDLAMVQIVVDILLVIILVLALSRLPGAKLRRLQQLIFIRNQAGIWRDAIISIALGAVVMTMSLHAILTRPRPSVLTPYFEAHAKTATGNKSIVGAILTDFRGIDTLIEITVFSIAGIGIFTLLCLAGRKFMEPAPKDEPHQETFTTLGIGGDKTSPLITGLAHVILPLALVIGVCQLLYGHQQPGDGFTAGVIVSIGVGFWYVVFGFHKTRSRLKWLKPSALIGWGILLGILSGLTGMGINGSFFSNIDFGKMWGLPLPKGVHLSTSLIFELAIALSVLGSVTHMINSLGRPEEGEA